jgi:hypothetical protein
MKNDRVNLIFNSVKYEYFIIFCILFLNKSIFLRVNRLKPPVMLASFGFSPCKSFSFNSALATYQFIGFPPQVDMLAYDWTEYPRGHTRWNFFFK